MPPALISARNYNNTAPPTNLTNNIDNSVNTTNIPVGSTSGYPPVPFTGCLERNTQNQEFVLVTSTPDTNHFIVVRGYDGTPPVQHFFGATFEHTTGAIDFREANQHHTDTTRDDHLQYVPVNGSRAITGVQSFSSGIVAQYLQLAGFPGANIQTRYVGGTGPAAPGPPGAGTFQVGDWIRDITGVTWTCMVAGSPGTWVPEPGRVMARVFGPGSHDVINTSYNAINYTFNAVRNVQYVIDIRVQGTVITALPSYINATLSVVQGATSLVSPTVYVMSLGSTALSVGGVYGDAICTAINVPTTTANATITVTVTSHGSGAYRLAGNSVEMILRRG